MSTCVGTKWIWQKKKSNMELKKTFVSLMATMTVSTHSSQLFQFHQIAHFPSDSKPIIIACNADLIRLRGAQERRCSLNPALICAILSDPNATAISRHTLVLHVNYQRALACWFDEVPKFKRTTAGRRRVNGGSQSGCLAIAVACIEVQIVTYVQQRGRTPRKSSLWGCFCWHHHKFSFNVRGELYGKKILHKR